MLPHNPLKTFKDLEAAKHIKKDGDTKTEYWWASDLYNILNPTPYHQQTTLYDFTHQNFIKPIFKKNKNSYPEFETVYPDDNHISDQRNNYILNGKQYQKSLDFQLSRYACWCICHANPKYIFQETYFLTSTLPEQQSFRNIMETSIEFERIAIRESIKKYEKQLNGIIKSNNANFDRFYNNLYQTLFGGHSLQSIRDSYNLPPKESVLNYMNNKTLQVYYTALYNTIEKYNTCRTPISLSSLTHNEFMNARIDGLNKHGCIPECSILNTHIKQIQKQYNNAIKNFVKQFYSNTK